MVHHEARGALARARRAGNDDDRRAFGIGAGNRVDQVEGAGPEGDDGDAESALITCRRIGRETDAGLMAQRVMRKNAALLDDLEERQHEIAGNPENFAGAVVLEALQQRGGERRHGATLRIRRANVNAAPAAASVPVPTLVSLAARAFTSVGTKGTLATL